MGVFRLLLAIAVVVAHGGRGGLFGLPMTGAQLSVQSFYMISGFVIAFVFTSSYGQAPNGTRIFWSNRFLRLWPSFIVVVIATVIATLLLEQLGHPVPNHFGGVADWTLHWREMTPLTRVLLALPNLLIVGTDWVLFWSIDAAGHLGLSLQQPGPLPAYRFMVIPQGWSLGVELSFYLVAPFLLRRSWRVWLAAAVLSVCLRLVLYYGFDLRNSFWTYRVFVQEAALFLAGSLSYGAYRWLSVAWSARRLRWAGAASAAVLWTFTLGYGFSEWSGTYWVFLAAVAVGLPFLFHVTRDIALDRFIGELSYPIYILHVGLLPFVPFLGLSDPHGLVLPTLSTAGAILIFVGVERPFRRIRRARAAKAMAVAAARRIP